MAVAATLEDSLMRIPLISGGGGGDGGGGGGRGGPPPARGARAARQRGNAVRARLALCASRAVDEEPARADASCLPRCAVDVALPAASPATTFADATSNRGSPRSAARNAISAAALAEAICPAISMHLNYHSQILKKKKSCYICFEQTHARTLNLRARY